MLRKLLKYSLKNQFKFFGVLYGLIIFNAVVSRLLGQISEAPMIITFVKKFCEGAMWAMIANVFINNVFRVWAEFRRSLFGDESYLMHTLPIKSSILFWSKFLGTAIVLAVNTIVSIVGVLILYASPEFFEWIKGIFVILANAINVSSVGYGIILGALILLEVFNVINIGFFAIICGHKKDNNKTMWSVIFGLIAYSVVQTIVIGVFAISGIFNSEMFGLFNGTGSSFDAETTLTLLIESCITYSVIIALMGVISGKLLNRGFDID